MRDWLSCLKKLLKVKEKGLLLTSHLVTGSQSLYHTWLPRGFWVDTLRKRLSWLRTLRIWLLTSAVGFEIWLVLIRTKTYSRMYHFKQTANPLLVGVLTLMVSILQLVLVALWLVGVPTYSLLTTRTQSRMQSLASLMFFSLHGNGFSLVRYSALCLVVLLLLL